MIDDRITAEEARKLSGPITTDLLKEAYAAIRLSAKEGKTSVNLTGSFWVTDGYTRTPQWNKIKSILEQDGFIVTFFYEERQFVNMYTVISWVDAKKVTPAKDTTTRSVEPQKSTITDTDTAAITYAAVINNYNNTDVSSSCEPSSYDSGSSSYDSGSSSSSCDSSSF